MLVDISINPKDLSCDLTYSVEQFSAEYNYSEAIAILSMVAGDFNIDPELEPEEFKAFILKAKEESKLNLTFNIDEDGLDLEFN